MPWEQNFSYLAQDQLGWTILSPSSKGRLIYVDQHSQKRGKVYRANDKVIGPDPTRPQSEPAAFDSIAAALSHMRAGRGDWLLLRRGTHYATDEPIVLPAGENLQTRTILTSYATDGSEDSGGNGLSEHRPIVLFAGVGMRITEKTSNIVISGIHFRPRGRIPSQPDFPGFDQVENAVAIVSTARKGESVSGILLEDLKIEASQINVLGQGTTDNFVLRRSVVVDNYSTRSHAQGLYSRRASVLLEENVFDHNGWLTQQEKPGSSRREQGQATMFNHNIYMSNPRDTIIRRNVFLRPSSMHNKFTANPRGKQNTISASQVLVADNFYLDGEIGISAGGNTDNDNGPRFEDFRFIANVFTGLGESRPTNRKLAWGIEVVDWQGGEVRGNLLTDFSSKSENARGLRVLGDTSGVNIRSNVIRGSFSRSAMTLAWTNLARTNVIQGNEIGNSIKNGPVLQLAGPVRGTHVFENNTLSGDEITIGRQAHRIATLLGEFGANSFTVQEGNTRGVSFAQYLHGIGMERHEFIAALRRQAKHSWQDELTATSINTYMRGNREN